MLRKSDRSILAQLERNSRSPFSRIGKRIHKSQQQVSYAVNTMMERGVIRYFNAIIDYSKLNSLNFRVFFTVNYISEEKFQHLTNALIQDNYTGKVITCGGRHDLITTFFAKNPSQFNKYLHRIMEKFPTELQNYTVLTTIVRRDFGRKYLMADPVKLEEYIVGGDREPEEVDNTDLVILSALSQDARKSAVEIASHLGVTPKTVIERIRKLEERLLVRGYRPSLDLGNLNAYSMLLVIRYHNVSSELEDELLSYLKVHPNVITAVKTLGEWDIEIEIEVGDILVFRKIERDIRQRFAALIQHIESVPLYQIHKRSDFPGYLLEE